VNPAVRSDVGYRSEDVYAYLRHLKEREGRIRGFQYRRILTDGHYGVAIGLFALQKDNLLKN